MGKLILIEGTDCSGKETQSKLLKEKIEKDNKTCVYFSFPNYNSPTGKIVGGPYLGKEEICKSYFTEGAVNVDPKVSSLYFAADRLYNLDTLKKLINSYDYVILDRYTFSNMAHQGGKEEDKNKRYEIYNFIYELEFNLLKLIKPDIVIFLHMPTKYALELRKNRASLDEHEKSIKHLTMAENAYLELKDKYNFKCISCVKEDKLRNIEDINDELYELIRNI